MKKFLMSLACLGILFSGCENSETNENISVVEEQNFRPFELGEKINLKSVTGGEITLERTQKGFKIAGSDKILLIDIFATYCEPCKFEAPILTDFSAKNRENFALVGLITFENVDNEHIIENFIKKYGAYYFIANDEANERIISQILSDISYQHALSIPFKVMYQNGEYVDLTDFNEGQKFKKYYLGAVPAGIIEQDFKRLNSGVSK